MSLKNLSAVNKIPKKLKTKLLNKRILRLYKNFEKSFNIKDSFIVAISGGPDSLALAFLTKIYSLKNGINSKFFIVDHKLRKESTEEAKLVQKNLKKFLINAKILTWRGKKPKKNIQSLARKKRFHLLNLECKKHKINNIILGHHLDDLLENFFIRMLRGSGLKGLTSLNKIVKFDDFLIHRPLLDFKKKDLIFLSSNVFNFFVEDPSNLDDKFKRIRIRNLIKGLVQEGLDKKKFLLTINNLNYSNRAISHYVDQNIRENSFFNKKKKFLILNNKFFDHAHEIVFRSLSESIKKIGNKHYPRRGRKIENIIKKIEKNTLFKETLGGCIIKMVNQSIIISKEY